MSNVSEIVSERTGVEQELAEEVESEIQMRLAREALETAESVDSILEKAVTGGVETEDTAERPDPYFADLVENGARLTLSYEGTRDDAGEQRKDVEVVSTRSFIGSEGFQHWDVHLRDLDRNESDQMQADFLVDDGEVVHTAAYGYSSSEKGAKKYGRRLGRDVRLSRPSDDEDGEGETSESDGEADEQAASSGTLMDDARRVVEEHDLVTKDWPTFQSEMISMDYSQSDASDAWSQLKEEGLIDEPVESKPPWEQDGDDDADDSGGDTGTDDDADDEPADLDVDAPDEVWLVTTEGCPGCQRAKDALEEYIPEPVQVRNVMEDDEIAQLAADGVIPTQAPMLIRVDDNELTLV